MPGNNGTEQFDGHLDDVAIWREVLPEGTIQALADGASPIGAGGAGATYSQNFDEFDDGTTDLEDGSVIFGQAASVQDGRLQLTIDQQGTRLFELFGSGTTRLFSGIHGEL